MKNKHLRGEYEISTVTLKFIVEKWDQNETIMNLVSRIKEVEIENGILKGEILEIKDNSGIDKITEIVKKKNKDIENLKTELRRLKEKKGK